MAEPNKYGIKDAVPGKGQGPIDQLPPGTYVVELTAIFPKEIRDPNSKHEGKYVFKFKFVVAAAKPDDPKLKIGDSDYEWPLFPDTFGFRDADLDNFYCAAHAADAGETSPHRPGTYPAARIGELVESGWLPSRKMYLRVTVKAKKNPKKGEEGHGFLKHQWAPLSAKSTAWIEARGISPLAGKPGLEDVRTRLAGVAAAWEKAQNEAQARAAALPPAAAGAGAPF